MVATPVIVSPTPAISDIMPPTPAPPVEAQVREALQQPNPATRLARTLDAIAAFLRDPNIRAVDDDRASQYLTDAAFSSERLIFADPVLARRQNDIAIVGLPNAMGLYLFDLRAEPGSPPLELSHWTAGLNELTVTWGTAEAGISYTTLGSDNVTRVHYILARRIDGRWKVTWFSDEQPDWWFNARDAVVAVAPDLSQVSVVGEAQGTTLAIIENGETELHRRFRLDWLREGDAYRMEPPLTSRQARQEWLWEVAEPGAYATLVEFLERLRLQDETGAGRLLASPTLMTTAYDLGLDWPERRYYVLIYDDPIIVFGDAIALYVATFTPPADESASWLIVNLKPLGAVLPTPTPGISVP